MKILFPTLLCAALYIPTVAWPGDNPDAQSLLLEAKQIHSQAVAMEGGWQTTLELISHAQRFLKKEPAKALTYAGKAKKSATLSLQLARDQKKNWKLPPYLK